MPQGIGVYACPFLLSNYHTSPSPVPIVPPRDAGRLVAPVRILVSWPSQAADAYWWDAPDATIWGRYRFHEITPTTWWRAMDDPVWFAASDDSVLAEVIFGDVTLDNSLDDDDSPEQRWCRSFTPET